MPLQDETVTFNFGQGIDTFSDPNQLPLGKFLALNNTQFIRAAEGQQGALSKRDGYGQLASPISSLSYITTYNNALVGLGQSTIQTYSSASGAWASGGFYQPIQFGQVSLVKNAYNQSNQDAALSPAGLVCLAYQTTGSATYQYAIFDSKTGQSVLPSTPLPASYSGQASAFGQVVGVPRVYSIGSSFLIAYGVTSSGTAGLGNLVITRVNNFAPFSYVTTALVDPKLLVVSNVTPANILLPVPKPIFDGALAANNLLLTWCTTTGPLYGATVTPALTISTTSFVGGSQSAYVITTVVDQTGSAAYTITASSFGLTAVATNFSFTQIFAPESFGVGSSSYVQGEALGTANVTGYANNGLLSLFYEPYSTAFAQTPQSPLNPGVGYVTNTIISRTITQTGVIGSETITAGELGIASKAFSVNGQTCLVGAFQSPLQSTYFLINSTGYVLSEIATGNGGGYCPLGPPNAQATGASVSFPYLYKDLIRSINDATALAQASFSSPLGNNATNGSVPNIFTQAGINYGAFNLSGSNQLSKECGGVSNLSGGFLWSFDTVQCVENNFFRYPEGGFFTQNVVASSAMNSQIAYQYAFVFEWTDNQANIHQSTPSLLLSVPAAPTTGSSGHVLVSCPVLRTTNKSSNNPAVLALYRWSQNQQVFYRMGGVPMTLNNTTIVSSSVTGTLSAVGITPTLIQFQDTSSDAMIVGNQILYTTGNVLPDSPGPASIAMALWDARLWLIAAETGQLWFSKPIIPATPLEMSQYQTIYVPDTQGAQGSSGQPKCIYSLNDKLIVFKKSMIFYINGTGPDITGNNSQYSEPIQIPSAVGCTNQNSIVLTPIGLMFQSDNGIWLLGQDLSMKYVGKDVEDFNNQTVLSATCVPGSTEVRFEMNSGTRLVYDFFVDQWRTDPGVAGISSAIFNGLHTVINASSQIYQVTSGVYSDGSVATVISFTTGWINLSGLQGFARARFMDLLGTFQSPHTYTVGIAYDYNSAIAQTATVSPYNVVGSGSVVEQWQIAFNRPRCQSFQLTFNEIASGTSGAGLILSGVGLTYAKKKSYPKNIPPKNRTG